MLEPEGREKIKVHLVAELHALALRGQDRWFDAPELKPLEVPFLQALATEIFEGVNLESLSILKEHIEALLRQAITRLPGAPAKHAVRSWQWVANALFGFQEIELVVGSSEKLYNNLVNSIRVIGKFPMRTDRMTNDVRTKMADILIHRLYEVRDLRNVLTAETALEYIRRPDIEGAVSRALIASSGVLLLHGDAGTGKSTLAKEIARRYTSDAGSTLYVNCSNEHIMLSDLSTTLRALDPNFAPAAMDRISLIRLLRIALGRLYGRRLIVILDGMDDLLTAQQLLPEDGDTSVVIPTIVTSRRELYSEQQAIRVWVSNMTAEEAVSMVEQRMPDISRDDAVQLARELDQRPLAIEHGITLILTMRPMPSVADFCAMIRLDVVALLDTASAEVKLTAIYRRLLRTLGEDESDIASTEIIAFLCFLGNHAPIELLQLIWVQIRGHGDDEVSRALDLYLVASAIERLRRLNLVHLGAELSVPFIFMHQLTHQIISSLLNMDDLQAFSSFVDTLSQHIKQLDWYPEHPILASPVTVHFIVPFLDFVMAMPDPSVIFPLRNPQSWAHCMSVALRYIRQVLMDGRPLIPLANMLVDRYPEYKDTVEFQGLYAAFLASGFVGYKLYPEIDSSTKLIYQYASAPFLFDAVLGEEAYSTEVITELPTADYLPTMTLPDLGPRFPEINLMMRLPLTLAVHSSELGEFRYADELLEEAYATDWPMSGYELWELQATAVRRGLRVCIRSNDLDRLETWQSRAASLLEYDDPTCMGDYVMRLRLDQALITARGHHRLQKLLVSAQHDTASPQLLSQMIRASYHRIVECYELIHQPYMLKSVAHDSWPFAALLSSGSLKQVISEFHAEENHSCFTNAADTVPACILSYVADVKNILIYESEIPGTDINGIDYAALMHDHFLALCVIGGLDLGTGRLYENIFPRAFHRSDTLLTAFVIAKRIGLPIASIDLLRNATGTILSMVERIDLLDVAERIGAGELQPAWLLAH